MDDSKRSNPLERFGMEFVDVAVCRPRLAWTLLGGGSAEYFDGTNTRVLDAALALQPLIHIIKMTGFLGLIQPLLRMVTPHYIQLRIYAGEKHGVDDHRLNSGRRRHWCHSHGCCQQWVCPALRPSPTHRQAPRA